jgi:hypothetical protein
VHRAQPSPPDGREGAARRGRLGRLATRRIDEALTRSAEASAPLLASAMDAGLVRRQDPLALGHWIARIAVACLLAPPPGDLLEALDALLVPMLDPDRRT